ncbi:hypothetical protein ABE43_22670 [Bacillus thuringiensis]|nr:hypothetical protein [Bacillus thuringiensis]
MCYAPHLIFLQSSSAPKTLQQNLLQKYKGYDVCPITGEASSHHMKLGDGKLTLSPEGAKQLRKELEQYLARA